MHGRIHGSIHIDILAVVSNSSRPSPLVGMCVNPGVIYHR